MNPLNIYTYENRRSKEYLDLLKEKLRLSGPNGLLKTAVPMPKRLQSRTPHERLCRISFLGLSANTIFDKGRVFIQPDEKPVAFKELREIFEQRQKFAKAGIWLRIRFLFVYPYSCHAMSMINAEQERMRCAMFEDWVHPSKQIRFQVDDDDFTKSTLYRSQQATLERLEELMRETKWVNKRGEISVVVRFTPISTNLCALFVNDSVFCDTYLMAKETRERKRLVFTSPLVQIDRGQAGSQSEYAFKSIKDHFQYLWQLNITLDCRDATHYNPEEPDQLRLIKRPEDIDYYYKGMRLIEHDETRRPCLEEGELYSWSLKALKQFRRYCAIPEDTQEEESIFISCSWTNHSPHKIASRIKRWIQEDFTNRELKGLKPIIVMAQVGDPLDATIYSQLNGCDLGIVLLTEDQIGKHGDSDEQWYSRPNLYHELGFLMGKFSMIQSNRKQLFIGIQADAYKPTNISNVVVHKIRPDPLDQQAREVYSALLKWLGANSILLRKNKRALCFAVEQHLNRILDEHEDTYATSGLAMIRTLQRELDCQNLPEQMSL